MYIWCNVSLLMNTLKWIHFFPFISLLDISTQHAWVFVFVKLIKWVERKIERVDKLLQLEQVFLLATFSMWITWQNGLNLSSNKYCFEVILVFYDWEIIMMFFTLCNEIRFNNDAKVSILSSKEFFLSHLSLWNLGAIGAGVGWLTADLRDWKVLILLYLYRHLKETLWKNQP